MYRNIFRKLVLPSCAACTITIVQDKNCETRSYVKKSDVKDEMKSNLKSAKLIRNLPTPKLAIQPNEKRKNVLSWEDYFMGIAVLSAQRSKDPITQVGACIVNDKKRIVGIGYNGMPDLINYDNDTKLPWGKKSSNYEETKHAYVCHAEMNAIVNKNSASLEGCTLYVNLFPCNHCAKLIIQSGIKEVIYYSDKKKDKRETKAAKIMFEAANIRCYQYKTSQPKIKIDFESINN